MDVDVAPLVLPGHREREVVEDARHQIDKSAGHLVAHVDAVVGQRLVLERARGLHEDVAVVDRRVLVDPAVDAVEEGLGDLVIGMTADELRIGGARLVPELQVGQVLAGHLAHQAHHVIDLALVEVDALGARFVHALPVRRLETLLGAERDVLVFGEVGLEAVQYGARHAARGGRQGAALGLVHAATRCSGLRDPTSADPRYRRKWYRRRIA